MAEDYPKTPANTVNRYRARGKYDYATIHNIVDTAPVLHIAFNPLPTTDPTSDPFPIILPMIGCTGSYDARTSSQASDPQSTYQDVYIHGYVSSRFFKLPSHSAAPDQPDDSSTTTTPVTISATLLDGLVLALTPNHHSMNYRSALLYGHSALVTDPAEKLWAMRRITDNVLPQRWTNTRVPPTPAENTSTSILRVRITTASAKVRSGNVGRGDRKDLADDDMRARVWTGVVPYVGLWRDPVPADSNRVVGLPGYIARWREGENNGAEQYALMAAEGKPT